MAQKISSCKNLEDQRMLDRPKNKDSKAVFQVTETDLASRTWRVSSKHSISQSSVIHHRHHLQKRTQSCQIVPHVIKILQNLWLIQVEYCIYDKLELTIIIVIWYQVAWLDNFYQHRSKIKAYCKWLYISNVNWSTQSCQIAPHVTKILQNFLFNRVHTSKPIIQSW